MFAALATFAALVTADAPGYTPRIDDPDGRALLAFHSSLRKTAARIQKTRILFFGASHTAADLLTGRLRDILQTRFGDGGHGFFMPAKPWKSYRKQHLNMEAPKRDRDRWSWEFVHLRGQNRPDGLYGMAGMAIQAAEKRQWSRFRTATEGTIGTRAAHLEIWYHRRPGGGTAVLKVAGEPRKFSIKTNGPEGLGIFETNFRDGGHAFELAPKGNGPVRLYGAVLERDAQGVVLDNLGVNGSKAAAMLRWDEATWARLAKRRDPALVVLAYGNNEAADEVQTIPDYEEELKHVLQRVRVHLPRASCLLVGPTDHPVSQDEKKVRRDPGSSKRFRLRKRTLAIIEVQRRVSASYGCGFYDHTAATGGPFSIVSWVDSEPRLAWHDYVHFTPEGYSVLGERLAEALLRGYDP